MSENNQIHYFWEIEECLLVVPSDRTVKMRVLYSSCKKVTLTIGSEERTIIFYMKEYKGKEIKFFIIFWRTFIQGEIFFIFYVPPMVLCE